MFTVFLIAGARPNFMKIAPLYRESRNHPGAARRIVHTGQHYDYDMSQAFFEDLELPAPDHFLESGSGSHAVQTARIMTAFETLCETHRPDLAIVVGDVNSTLACSITAKKLLIDVAHVEAGLRSFDLTMPEEINRRVTDAVSDLLFVTEESGVTHLTREGKDPERIFLVGNVMIDNLFHQLNRLERMDPGRFASFPVKGRFPEYAFLTLHRPSNVDSREALQDIAGALNDIASNHPILFPVHPRTRNSLQRFDIRLSHRIVPLPPLGFTEALFLWKDAAMVLTDSGGLQEETSALGIPCLTLRNNTERPVTLTQGSNVLAGTTRASILEAYQKVLNRRGEAFPKPPLWDGNASARIWRALSKNYGFGGERA